MMQEVRRSELFLFTIVALLSIAANLPEQSFGSFINKKLLLAVLAGIVVIALLRYLRLFLLLCVVTLAIGANVPDRIADSLGIHPATMLVVLALIVVMALVNVYLKMLPTDRVQASTQKEDNEHTRREVLIAVSKGNLTRLKWLLNRNVEINFSLNGVSPVIVAAEKGYSEIMQLLVHHGAEVNVTNADGKNALEIAQANGFHRTAEIIRFASENPISR